MTSLFTQVWLWSLLAFVVGAACTWLLVVRPLRAKVSRLDYLLENERRRRERESSPVDEPGTRQVEFDQPDFARSEFDTWDGRDVADSGFAERGLDRRDDEFGYDRREDLEDELFAPRDEDPGYVMREDMPQPAPHLPERGAESDTRAVADFPEWEREPAGWPEPISRNGSGATADAAPDATSTQHPDAGSGRTEQVRPVSADDTSVIPTADLDSAKARPRFQSIVGQWPEVTPEDGSGEVAPPADPESTASAERTAQVPPVDTPAPQDDVPGWFQKPYDTDGTDAPDGPDDTDAPDGADGTETVVTEPVDPPTASAAEAESPEPAEPRSPFTPLVEPGAPAVNGSVPVTDPEPAAEDGKPPEFPEPAPEAGAAGITVRTDPDAAPLPRRTPGAGPRPGSQNLKARTDEAETTEQAPPAGSAEGAPQAEGDVVKGHLASKRYHTPDSPYYDRIVAEVWFPSAAEAEQAGFEPWDGWLRGKRD